VRTGENPDSTVEVREVRVEMLATLKERIREDERTKGLQKTVRSDQWLSQCSLRRRR
jgi:hypothetical protein